MFFDTQISIRNRLGYVCIEYAAYCIEYARIEHAKVNTLYCLSPNPAAEQKHIVEVLVIFYFQNCRQITATARRSIFHAVKSSQMPFTKTKKEFVNFNNKIL